MDWLWLPPAAIGGWLLYRMATRLPPASECGIGSSRFGLAEGVFASLLAMYFILGIVTANVEERVVTEDSLWAGIIVNLALTSILTGFFMWRGFSVARTFGFDRIGWRTVIAPGLVMLVAVYPLVVIFSSISRKVLGDETRPDPTILFIQSNPSVGTLWLAGVLIVIVAPFVEEYLFRGLLYTTARQFAGRFAGLVATSVLFSAVHLNPSGFISLVLLSAALTLAYERTGSLWAPIVMHMVFNGVQYAVVLMFPQLL